MTNGELTCPECHHGQTPRAKRLSKLRLFLWPATCPVAEDDVSGWGVTSCNCKHPIHH